MKSIASVERRDCLKWMRELPSDSVDLILTDPPFGHGTLKWDVESPAVDPQWWAEIARVTKRRAAVICFAQGRFTAQLVIAGRRMWRYNLVWQKNKPTGFLNANRMPLRSHEDLCVFYAALPPYQPQLTVGHPPQHRALRRCTGANYGDTEQRESRTGETTRHPRSVLAFPVVNNDDPSKFHPTQKPVPLLRWLIRAYSRPGDVVADPFAGSGATGVAAILEGRRFIGCDRDDDEQYVQRANDWLKQTSQGQVEVA